MRDVKTWIIVGLGIVIVVLLLFWPSYEPPDTTVFKREIAAQNKQIAVLSAELKKKAEKFQSDSLRLAKDSVEHKKHVSKLESRISQLKANTRVVYIREQEPSIDSLITAQDSLIVRSVQRVAALEGEMFALRQDMSKVFTDCESRFQAQLEKEKLTEAENERLAKEVKKGRRKKKLAQILIPIVGVGAFLIGAQ
jgi:hypothetical protein